MSSKRIESRMEIELYLAKLKYALDNGAQLFFQIDRRVDDERNKIYTNRYTVATLFPNENPAAALRKELHELSVKDYMCTLKDERFPNRSEMRVFGRKYNSDDVYIKIRVELADPLKGGNHTTFVMSFHFAEKPLAEEDYPYRK